MNQEIVFGSSLMDYLDKNYDPGKYNSPSYDLLKRLQEDIICFDKSRLIDEEIEKNIYDLDNEVLLWLWTDYENYLNKKRFDVAENSSIDLIEGEIASKTLDHLNIKENQSTNLLKKLKDKFGKKIILKSFDEYLNPDINDIIIYNGRNIDLNKGVKFHFYKYLKVCFRNTNKVIIEDRFLGKDQTRRNLKAIIRRIPNDSKIIIKTLSDLERQKHQRWKDNFSVKIIEEELNETFPVKKIRFIYGDRDKIHHDRSIKSDKWFIMIGTSLDFFEHESGKILNDTNITFHAR